MKGKHIILTMIPVLFLSGCTWFGGGAKEEGKPQGPAFQTAKDLPAGALAVWADGTPLLTQKEFDEVLDIAMKEQPELQGLAEAFMPMLKRQLFNTLVQHKIIGKWVKENKIDQSAEYKQKMDQVAKAITQKVNVDFFAKRFEYTTTDKDLKEYYDKNKDRVALVAKGGTKATGVKFDKEADAKAFLAKAQAKGADLEKLAEADKKKVEDFLFVNAESRISKQVKDAILAIKSFPTVTLVKENDKTFWVVKATEKQDTQYRTYDEMKEQLENIVKQTKQGEALMGELQKLQQKYGVKVKEDAFMPPKKEASVPAQMMPAPEPADKKAKGKAKVKEAPAPKAPKKATKAA